LTREHESGETNLCVCKNCLTHLNYKNYDSLYYERKKIFDGFSLKEFFETYKQYFKYKPEYKAGERRSTYVDDS
jgi:hypothetical protein